MRNYHCLTSYTTKTFSECVSDTTEIPDKKQLPSLYQADVVTHSAADLTEALQKPSPSSLTPNLGEKKLQYIQHEHTTSTTNSPLHNLRVWNRHLYHHIGGGGETKQPTVTVPPVQVLRQMVKTKTKIATAPG